MILLALLAAISSVLVQIAGNAQARDSNPTSAPAASQGAHSSSEYDEQRIGPWMLRTDRKARTFGVIWMNTGVIELAARSADGKAEISIRDNGGRLSAMLTTPGCIVGAQMKSYEGQSNDADTLAQFTAELPTLCVGYGYDAEISSWTHDLPAASRAMKLRAIALYGPDPTRCVEPPFRSDRPPPPHPICGFPAPAIGENHQN
ncbi:hypothetical protein E2493_20625 [Sphingomonas parva]|uniref:Uncharacterized protein n=1 Tax=Sphingomonas parva TaxID=2555898 RepID=A0A4Y8ZLN3_9SPHN|nr:hypothetical protein [Sphingomonas parva]TFI56347.1 hypothetical protein E2493_20625 [Sphingomonas parva]